MNNLKDKSFKQYGYICRYSAFPYYYNIEDKKYIQGTTGNLKTNISYVTHKVKYQDTFDSLSLYYYNSPLYYWVIMDFNQIQDPFQKLKIGQILKIPALNDIEFKDTY